MLESIAIDKWSTYKYSSDLSPLKVPLETVVSLLPLRSLRKSAIRIIVKLKINFLTLIRIQMVLVWVLYCNWLSYLEKRSILSTD